MQLVFQAPPHAGVVISLKNGMVLNLLGMGAAILGMQAIVGLLVAKALTSSVIPYYQGISPGKSPILALDVFLMRVCRFLYVFLFNMFFLFNYWDLEKLFHPFTIWCFSFCLFMLSTSGHQIMGNRCGTWQLYFIGLWGQ